MRFALPLLLLLGSCGEPVAVPNMSAEANEAAAEPMVAEARPVRVGELGPSLPACSGAGMARRLPRGESLTVRSSPFDSGSEIGAVPQGARFFVCTRSHDQKWLGIVYAEEGTLAERCGVAEPLARRRDYEGPCRSGWVQSAFVKLVAGETEALPQNQPDAQEPANAAAGA